MIIKKESIPVLEQDNLTAKQNDYAVFLPAISGFYATFIGKQRVNNDYVDPARMPAGMQDMEQMNWLNSTKSLFPYRWSLYSGGHANLDLAKDDASEYMVRNREPGTFMLGDSGGFQIAKGLWEGDWKANSGCAKAQKKRDAVLKWLDGIADYGMILDIPTWVIHDKKASNACQITTLDEAVAATKYNNDYFMKHRKGKNNGGARFLNVLQGDNHSSAEEWYQIMKEYCDPAVYPSTHFDGWAMGGQNMCDVHLVLKRLVALRHDNLLQEGVHDWMHFLGTSKLEWALLLTDIQRAVRKYVNPAFTISFDCASPFLATANGQMYHQIDLPHNDKWCYRMGPSADNKKYATDTRPFKDVVLADKVFNHFDESPISQHLQIKDVCIYKPGDLNKIGKEGKTSWDSFSYALMMGHNVWMHIEAVQRANREYDAGTWPAMMWNQGTKGRTGDHAKFRDIVDAIFATSDKQESLDIIEHYSRYWMDIIGTRGFKGDKTINAHSQFNSLFEFVEPEAEETERNEKMAEEAAEDRLGELLRLDHGGE
jgi:hypothetical protein